MKREGSKYTYYKPCQVSKNLTGLTDEQYHVEKMRFPKKGQKETIIYNSRITIKNIPAKVPSNGSWNDTKSPPTKTVA